MKSFARLEAVYGVPRDRSPELMTAAWLEALGHLEPDVLKAAVGQATRTLKFFPTPAEILAIVSDQREQVSRLPHYSADMEPPFAPTPDELQRVSEMVRGFVRKFGPEPVVAETVKPASQDMTVSDALRNSRAARATMAGAA